MKFFNRAFIHGAMSVRQRKARIAAYARYMSSLGLSRTLDQLGRLNLHDARVLAFKYEPRKRNLHLRVCCGDLQTGYCDVRLHFENVTISPTSQRILRTAAAKEFEVLASELLSHRDAFKYSLLLWPKGEASVVFKTVRMKMRPVSTREQRRKSRSCCRSA